VTAPVALRTQARMSSVWTAEFFNLISTSITAPPTFRKYRGVCALISGTAARTAEWRISWSLLTGALK
jgi:hypothetical protein